MKNTVHTNTQIIGIIGHPIKHTFSPFIHNVAIEVKNLDYLYLPFDVEPANLKNALKGMTALNIKGFNVTVPHKEAAIPLLNKISKEAEIIGSINTIVNDSGKLFGYNTDVNGVYETLIPYKDQISGNEVSVIGAGGSSRAVIYNLISHFEPSSINIINRTLKRAEELKDYFSGKMKYNSFNTVELSPPEIVGVLNNSKLIVNTTSVGMWPEVENSFTSINKSFTKGQIVFDLVYNPPRTKLLKMASAEGAITLDGLKMLIFQAAKAFEIWTGEEMPIAQIEKALNLYITH
jgi:shikimate dehydrogenase